jgi:hypothetical protein
VFSKLISRFQDKKSVHPLGCDANIDALLEDIPQLDPGRVLLDIDHWLSGMEGCATEIGTAASLHALARLDQFSRAGADEFLTRYLSPAKREYLSDATWSLLETHAAHLFDAYKAFVTALPELSTDKDKTRAARSGARALRAWALRKKLQRFRYRRPSTELWLEAHELLQFLGRLGLLQLRVTPYSGDAETTPLREYLIGLYLEFVPVGNMAPQQLELTERFLRTCETLELSLHADLLSTDQIDLAAGKGPQRFKEGEAGGSSVRYCSVLKLRGDLMKFAAQLRHPDQVPHWLVSLPATPEQIRNAVTTLMTYWAPKPPKRCMDRIEHKVEVRVVLGFGLARRMIAASQLARKGVTLKYEGYDLARLFDENRFGHVGKEADVAVTVAEPSAVNPLEILRKLELSGDRAQMERWLQIDASESGVGAVVPAVLARHRIGLLVCLRYQDGLDWRIGLIRRIGRDAENHPSIGIETLAWPSIPAQVKTDGEETVWNKVTEGGDGWLDGIIVSREGTELLLPAGTFVAGIEIDVRSEEGPWRARLESLLDQGADFDRIEFTRISQGIT